MKQRFSKVAAAATITGIAAFGFAPVAQFDTPVHAATSQETSSQTAVKNINEIYNAAVQGEVPRLTADLKIGKSLRQDVRDQFGPPPEGSSNNFDYYHAEMGHPGYAFGYDQNNVINEIRYFGTNVERQTNLGSITQANLKKELGQPNFTSKVKGDGTTQTKYTYHAGAYDLEFIFDDSKTLNHVNLVKKP
ncbi:YjgB family protein [Priestia megaterium]|uniref:YjgB family protein n=1 Tax=Priestia megaterium TaxID=1404 RepID=UPI001F499649|nr:YjgB family protein [Priestia megaterium]MED3863077.1 YjgB family protein [Priestia megaterium]MED4099394.1 YjgB family protein [Priestia megaterium]MED4144034.1 YjgB family protein [Priestia megaterium]MED4166714.1 YjgB family protein [Priestia megaterium]MED4197012.1 YjgB family protein [Priestia megaterium]